MNEIKTLNHLQIKTLHDRILQPHELQGLAANKSLESVIARVDNRLAYGLIQDVYELAACYATYIATGHAFNDGNKRTAFGAMRVILKLNGIHLQFNTEEVGDLIIQIARGEHDEMFLAEWLRQKHREQEEGEDRG